MIWAVTWGYGDTSKAYSYFILQSGDRPGINYKLAGLVEWLQIDRRYGCWNVHEFSWLQNIAEV